MPKNRECLVFFFFVLSMLFESMLLEGDEEQQALTNHNVFEMETKERAHAREAETRRKKEQGEGIVVRERASRCLFFFFFPPTIFFLPVRRFFGSRFIFFERALSTCLVAVSQARSSAWRLLLFLDFTSAINGGHYADHDAAAAAL